MGNTLISTLYAFEPVILASTKIGVDKLILIIDNKPVDKQRASLELVKQSLGKVVEVKQIKTEVYDIVNTAEEVIKAIDYESDKNSIFVNITEEEKKIIYLPKLGFNLNNSQKLVLEYINNKELTSLAELSNKIKISRGMLYRTIKELKDLGLIYDDNGFKLTDAGRIAVL